jgi:Protein of unknown function (DUF2510)
MVLRVTFAALPPRVVCVVGALVAGLVLTACSPPDRPAVKLSSDGSPVLLNCGTWIRGIEVYDADSGRLVWSASKQDLSTGYGVAEVEVGLLPTDADWIEIAPLQMTPAPTTWRFVDVGVSSRTTLEVASEKLSTEAAFVFRDGTSTSLEDYRRDTCGYGPWLDTLPVLNGVLFVLVVGGAVLLVGALLGRNRSRLARRNAIGESFAIGPSVVLPPAGWYPEPGAPWILRWWNGVQWTEHRAVRPPRP